MMFFATSPRRARLIGIALLVTTFLVGALGGAAVVRVLDAREPAAAGCAARDGGRDDRGPDIFERLDLSAEQRVQIETILERRRSRMEAFWSEYRPQLRAMVDSTRAEIREVLTPEQRAEEDRFRAERKAYYRERDGKHQHKYGEKE